MNFLKNLLELFVPNRCLHCKNCIPKPTNLLCLSCSLQLQHTTFIQFPNNPIEKLFWGRATIINAGALYFYDKKTPIQTLLKELKYNGLQEFGTAAAKTIIYELKQTTRFQNIDIVVPVPLHPEKEKLRGYNQIESFGKTLAAHFNVPFCKNALKKTINNSSQTQQNKEERHQSVKNNYQLNQKNYLNDKHILLVDDVLTTGATLMACINALQQVPNINISIITIACVV